MIDFTLEIYTELLLALTKTNWQFYHFSEYFSNIDHGKVIFLRHDVDAKKNNSLIFARIQHKNAIKGTYYFRVVPQSFDKTVILRVADLGHEIGYHYETMDTCNGNVDRAYDEFCRYLEQFRKLYPVTTVCMHGSPLSKFDNRAIWDKYDYRNLGITAEPYFDLDFNRFYYLTDTGRRWDGDSFSVRDKPFLRTPLTNTVFQRQHYHSTEEIIGAIISGTFPDHAMMTFHPQRWTDNVITWSKEYLLQNIKNIIKKQFFVK